MIPYDLHVKIPWDQVTNDNYIKYQVPGHPDTFLTGPAGFKAAIRGHYFALISFPTGALVNGNDRAYVAGPDPPPATDLSLPWAGHLIRT